MKKLIVLLFVLVNLSFAQSNNKNYVKAEHSYFTTSDSIQTSSFLFTNKRANSALKDGLWGVGAGAVVGLITAIFVPTENGVGFLMFPILGAGFGFVSGTTIGYFINEKDGNQFINYPFSHRPLLSIGVSSSFSVFTSKNSSYEEYAFGLSYRNTCKSFYIPNRVSLLFKQTLPYGSYHYKDAPIYDDTLPKQFSESKFGINALHIQHSNVVGFLYGFEFGLTNVTYSDYIALNEWSDEKSKLLPYFDAIVGINFNLASFASLEFFYYYELFGSYQGIKGASDNLLTHSQQVGLNLLIYFR
jgi:hypothetical protein